MSFHHNKHVYTLVPMVLVGLPVTYQFPVQALYLLAVHAVSIEYTYVHTSVVFHGYIVESNPIISTCACVRAYVCVCMCVCAYFPMCICICMCFFDAALSLRLTVKHHF